MRRGVFVGLATWVAVLASVAGQSAAPAATGQTTAAPRQPAAAAAKPVAQPAPDHSALVKQYCITCHNARLKTGGLTLDDVSLTDIPAGAEVWVGSPGTELEFAL